MTQESLPSITSEVNHKPLVCPMTANAKFECFIDDLFDLKLDKKGQKH